ncbi:MAG: hypothetical protein ACTSW1_05470 [Candidatus Hodarchaeales archaeon]
MLRIGGTPLEQQSWDNVLRMESMTRDVYQDFEGTFSDDKKTVPDGIGMKVKLAPSAHFHTVGFLKNLSGSGVTGRDQQINQEIDQQLKELNVYANDVSQAVNTERYGIDAHDKKAYKILEAVQPQLSLWHKEIKGKYIREGLLERYSVNNTVAPISQTKRWNENFFVKGVTLSAQPVYDSTNATYESNISAAGVTGGASAAWDVPFLNALIYQITTVKKIKPMDNGRYVVTVPSRQAIGLKDPSASDSIAGLFKDSHLVEAASNAYKWYLGSYGPMDLYEDPRAPVIDDNSANLSALYQGAGDDDDRDSGTGTVYDVGFVHGKGSYVVAEYEMLHFEEEIQNYKKIVGVGAFAGYGVTRTVFDDVGSESDTSAINQSSMAIMARRQTITA